MDQLSAPKPVRRRRRHSPEFKARIVAACQEPGVSVARVALEHGLNDNLVRRWIKASSAGATLVKPDFIPLALPAPSVATPPSVVDDVISIEVPRANGAVTIRWPASQAQLATAFLRELLL